MNNEELFEKFLVRFLDNTLLTELCEEINKGDVQEAFQKAHALKGVCGNLSMEGILAELEPIVEILRAGSLEGVRERIPALEESYKKTIDAVRQL